MEITPRRIADRAAFVPDQRIIRLDIGTMDIAPQHGARTVVLSNQGIAVIGKTLSSRSASGYLTEPACRIVFEGGLRFAQPRQACVSLPLSGREIGNAQTVYRGALSYRIACAICSRHGKTTLPLE